MQEWDEAVIETEIMKEIISKTIKIPIEKYLNRKFEEKFEYGVSISNLYAENREGRVSVRTELDLNAEKKLVERLNQKSRFSLEKTQLMLWLGNTGLAKKIIIPKQVKSFLKADLDLKIEELNHLYENGNLHIHLKADAAMTTREFEMVMKRFGFA